MGGKRTFRPVSEHLPDLLKPSKSLFLVPRLLAQLGGGAERKGIRSSDWDLNNSLARSGDAVASLSDARFGASGGALIYLGMAR